MGKVGLSNAVPGNPGRLVQYKVYAETNTILDEGFHREEPQFTITSGRLLEFRSRYYNTNQRVDCLICYYFPLVLRLS